jgi:DNA-binding HxlR family transcriptional regulator
MSETITLTGPLSPRDGWTADLCSIDKAIQVLSTRSALLILREAFYGTTRFDDFADRVGISEPVAAARLKELVAEGLLERVPYREGRQRTRHQYRMTEKGADLFPVLVALMQWGDRWLAPSGAPVALRHHGCGEHVGVHLRCDAGHETAPAELDLVVGPGSRRGRGAKRPS